MPQQLANTVENNFSKGLITETNPLNFPENAATDADNCIFTINGEVTRRLGFNTEENSASYPISSVGQSINSYTWSNAGGDGVNQILVVQVGATLLFYLSSQASIASPLSVQLIGNTITLTAFTAFGNTFDSTVECEFTDGNGYLFVFHPDLEPFFCTYFGGVIVAQNINVQTRDFTGTIDGLPVNQRPGSLSIEHQYNLANQGWTQGSAWIATDATTIVNPVALGSHAFTITAGLPISNGDNVQIFASYQTYGFVQDSGVPVMTGSVTSYVGTTLTLNVYSILSGTVGGNLSSFTLTPIGLGYVNTWFGALGNYPSNADVWWKFKNASGAFDPATTNVKVTLNSGEAPKGHYILNAFHQQRSLLSGIAGLTDLTTNKRPKTGVWFQGRVWMAGTDGSTAPTGDQLHYSWSENIYFSQVISTSAQFGFMYQTNDPTSEDFFDLLPTDGGVIRIQGSGSIHKLFPIQNGLLAFGDNGIWFITGSQGIGFSANDYTVTKISSIETVSTTSFVNVQGYPMFWNNEGIWGVSPAAQGGGLTVDNICLGTILTYYNNIPTPSKLYARGDFDPINYVITWMFKGNEEANVTDRYRFEKALCYNVYTKAFYTYSLPLDTFFIAGVKFVKGKGGEDFPEPRFKYITTFLNGTRLSFSEERDSTNWVDFAPTNVPYTSFFTTGYKVHGQAMRKWQPIYVNVFSNGSSPTFYKIQGIWDFANDPNSGRYSNVQYITNALSRFGFINRRHKIRGRGLTLQFKIESVAGQPFDIMGWSTFESSNTGV